MNELKDRCTSALVYDVGEPYKPMYRCGLPAGHKGVHQATVGEGDESTVVTWTRGPS